VRQEIEPQPIAIQVVNAKEIAAVEKVLTVKRDDSGKLSGAVSQPISGKRVRFIGNVTEARGINNSQLVCGDYLDSAGAFEGFFFPNNVFTNYAPEPTFTVVLGVNNAGDFCGSEIPSSTGIQSAFVNIGGVLTDFVVTDATATLA